MNFNLWTYEGGGGGGRREKWKTLGEEFWKRYNKYFLKKVENEGRSYIFTHSSSTNTAKNVLEKTHSVMKNAGKTFPYA